MKYKLLYILRLLGVFRLSRRLTARRLRILCYHGISQQDEHDFNAGVFMRRETFEQRMALIKKLGLPVITLDDAVRKLDSGQLPPLATVITIDDGWYGTYAHMYPVLTRLNLPATLYVATAFVESQLQVFNVATGYVLWRNRDKTLRADTLRSGALTRDYDLGRSQDHAAANRELTRFGYEYPDFRDRHALWREICDALDEDWKSIEAERRLAFINDDELLDMMTNGVDIQLHTHGHRFPSENREEATQEVVANREYLNGIRPGEYSHFCYPSGQYQVEQIDDLRSIDIMSATTTKGGLNRYDTPLFELRRLIDSDKNSELEFEARLSGLMDLLGDVRSRVRESITALSGTR